MIGVGIWLLHGLDADIHSVFGRVAFIAYKIHALFTVP